MSNLRPRRGKQMPMIPPQVAADTDDSESEESVASVASIRSGSDLEEATFAEGDEEVAGAAVATEEMEVGQPDDGSDEEEEDEDDSEEDDDAYQAPAPPVAAKGGRRSTSRPQVTYNDGVSDDDEEVEDLRPPPTPGITLERRRDAERENTPLNLTDPRDYGKIYSELIDTCNSLETDAGLDENFQEVMIKNIQTGRFLFEHLIKGTVDGSSGEEHDSAGKRRAGVTGSMFLAFLHTKVSSAVVRHRAERIGSGASIFSVEGFLESLKREYVDENGDYSAKLAAANIAMQASLGSKSLMPLVAVVGTFDRDAVIVPKFKKPRAPIRRTNLEEQQDDSSNVDNNDNMQVAVKKNPADAIAKDMNKILKLVHRKSSDPVNLFEFVMDRKSFPKTIENIFYLSFLIKDGHVSLTKEENGKLKDLSLNIKPEKSQRLETNPPDEEDGTRNQTHRQKYILSFSPKMWKQMCQVSQGEDVISFYQAMMEQQTGGAGGGKLLAIQDK